MNWSAFEKHVQDTFQNKEEVLDTNRLIANIFREEKKKKIFPWWWMLAALITGGLGVWFLSVKMYHHVNTPLVTNETLEKVLVDKKSGPSAVNTSEAKDIQEPDYTADGLYAQTERDLKGKNNLPVSGKNKPEEKNPSGLFITHLGEVDNRENVYNPVLAVTQIPSPEVSPESMFPYLFPKRKTVECPTFSNRKRISFFLQPEAGFALPQKSLESVGSEMSDVVRRRIDNEKTLEGLQAALYLGMNIGRSPFYLKTGLAYTRISEKTDLQYEYTRQDTTYGIISITKSQTGDTLTVIYGDIITQSTIEGQKIKHHYFHLLDIPLCAGYQFPVSPKWTLNAEAGLVFNISMRVQGDVLASRSDFLPAAKENYQPSLGFGYRAGIDVEYAVSPVIGLGLQARINGYGRNFSSGNADFRQSYLIPGAQLFLKYYFTN